MRPRSDNIYHPVICDIGLAVGSLMLSLVTVIGMSQSARLPEGWLVYGLQADETFLIPLTLFLISGLFFSRALLISREIRRNPTSYARKRDGLRW